MEWYTLAVVLGVFLLWAITSLIVNGCIYALSAGGIVVDLGYLFIKAGVPVGFVDLLAFVPHMFLVGVYMMYLPPPSEWFKIHPIWQWLRTKYFDISEVGAPKTDGQYLYAVFPHGVFASGTIANFTLNEKYKDVVTVGTSLLFWIPLVREFTALGGAIPANSHDIVEHLDQGKDVLLLPEGLRSLINNTNKGTQQLLAKRKGFIRCAIGSTKADSLSIVPVYADGQRELYHVFMGWPWMQSKLLSKWYYPWPVLSWGNNFFPFFPKPGKIVFRFGTPIAVGGKTVDEISDAFTKQVELLMEQPEEE